MVQFKKLRLVGFKSFVDPTELHIEHGLTGIIGPNGCGKSNLVEALRWVMGESSAKKMRGGEMDDVIFGGTRDRPARNLAEVTVALDNSDRKMPAAFNQQEEVEVGRRIERGAGSAYRVNGRDTRARDVQTLFADVATGARSTALVSQGRVGALIAAKPTDRRALLEEAAGITGLHSRRHEAELRLRAAETNLERLDDVLAALETQQQGLKRQARQAARYRSINDRIRRTEAMLLHLKWQAATADLTSNTDWLAETDRVVGELSGAAAARSSEQADAAAVLPGLREAEATAAAELHRLAVARDGLEQEEQRLQAAKHDLETRLQQLAGDMTHQAQLVADAGAALETLERDIAALNAAAGEEAAHTEQAKAAFDEAAAALTELETDLGTRTEQLAADEARQQSLAREIEDAATRLENLAGRHAAMAAEQQELERAGLESTAFRDAKAAVEQAETQLLAARDEAAAAEQAHAAARAAEVDAQDARQAAAAKLDKLRAEVEALADVLAIDKPDMWPPLIDAVTVDAGYEVALGAALGDDLTVPADDGAPVHWRRLPPLADAPALPRGVESLAHHVRAPEALARRLGQIGVVGNDAEGRVLMADLAPGQRLVSRDGALWRWDGYCVAAGTEPATVKRLAQRRRLRDLEPLIVAASDQQAAADAAHREARDQATAAAEREREARDRVGGAMAAVQTARDGHNELTQQDSARNSRLSAIAESLARLGDEEIEIKDRLAEAEAARAGLPDLAACRQTLATDAATAAERRQEVLELRSTYDRAVHDAAERASRLDAANEQARSWHDRADAAKQQLARLKERHDQTGEDLKRLAERPEEIARQRSQLYERIEASEGRRRSAADELARAETRLAEADKAVKAADTRLAEARESRVRAEAAKEQAEIALTTLAERIRERVDSDPDGLAEVAGLKEGAEPPEIATVDAKLERLFRERDNMGPVNLRAEQESAELEEQITTLQTEREDLVSAIGRLRHGINSLNREGRERLLAAFESVNTHFKELFVRLFGGGRAHLQLSDMEDPLEAGLEIMASPPGKRLQTLSLLSGGEQALTAIALLFAVFLTNPAPICVLDEVDAPLDDANVDRFCTLLEEIAGESETRFLLITHHRMTMARVDRLYGVTMAERGVSQLVSVDLGTAEQLRATA